MRTISITVTGNVQGVFYRQSTREKALSLDITGEVRNHPNGDVLILATGPASSLDELVAWCKQGPPKAVVHGVEVVELPLQVFEQFRIIRF